MSVLSESWLNTLFLSFRIWWASTTQLEPCSFVEINWPQRGFAPSKRNAPMEAMRRNGNGSSSRPWTSTWLWTWLMYVPLLTKRKLLNNKWVKRWINSKEEKKKKILTADLMVKIDKIAEPPTGVSLTIRKPPNRAPLFAEISICSTPLGSHFCCIGRSEAGGFFLFSFFFFLFFFFSFFFFFFSFLFSSFFNLQSPFFLISCPPQLFVTTWLWCPGTITGPTQSLWSCFKTMFQTKCFQATQAWFFVQSTGPWLTSTWAKQSGQTFLLY